MAPPLPQPFKRALRLLERQGGVCRMSDAVAAGIPRKTLYAMRDAGALEQVSRGLYRIASSPPLSNPDLATVAARIPRGVICLTSALAFHELTTQVPHAIDVALARGARKPRLDYPPVHYAWFSGPAFRDGIETHRIDNVAVRVYDPEKTLVDCFRYRNKLGADIVIEAFQTWRDRRRHKLDALLRYARMRHVERVLRPYVEVTI